MGSKRIRSRKKRKREHGLREMEFTIRVLGDDEQAALQESLSEPSLVFDVVSVEPGRGLWLRESELFAPEVPAERPIPGAAVFLEDAEYSRLFQPGDWLTAGWKNGSVAIPSAMRESTLAWSRSLPIARPEKSPAN